MLLSRPKSAIRQLLSQALRVPTSFPAPKKPQLEEIEVHHDHENGRPRPANEQSEADLQESNRRGSTNAGRIASAESVPEPTPPPELTLSQKFDNAQNETAPSHPTNTQVIVASTTTTGTAVNEAGINGRLIIASSDIREEHVYHATQITDDETGVESDRSDNRISLTDNRAKRQEPVEQLSGNSANDASALASRKSLRKSFHIRDSEDPLYGLGVALDSDGLQHRAKGLIIGLLPEWPPPMAMQDAWEKCIETGVPLNDRFMFDLINAVQKKLGQIQCDMEHIEAELCMIGYVKWKRTTVDLKPAIAVRCRTKKCRRVLRRAISDISYLPESLGNERAIVEFHGPRAANLHSRQATQTSLAQAPSSGGLSRGTIAGIVIGVVAWVGALLAGIFYLLVRKRRPLVYPIAGIVGVRADPEARVAGTKARVAGTKNITKSTMETSLMPPYMPNTMVELGEHDKFPQAHRPNVAPPSPVYVTSPSPPYVASPSPVNVTSPSPVNVADSSNTMVEVGEHDNFPQALRSNVAPVTPVYVADSSNRVRFLPAPTISYPATVTFHSPGQSNAGIKVIGPHETCLSTLREELVAGLLNCPRVRFIQSPSEGSACGLMYKSAFSIHPSNSSVSTIGGCLRIGDKLWGLTTAHGILLGLPETADLNYANVLRAHDPDGTYSVHSDDSNGERFPENEESEEEDLEDFEVWHTDGLVDARVKERTFPPRAQSWTAVEGQGPIGFAEFRYVSDAQTWIEPLNKSCDFALVSLDSLRSDLANSYQVIGRDQATSKFHVDGILSDESLTPGPVHVLTALGSPQEGYLLPGRKAFSMFSQLFHTRKIRLQAPLCKSLH